MTSGAGRALVAAMILLASGCVGPTPATGPMVFEVEVPANTPAGDAVWIYIVQKGHKMEKVGDFTHRFELDASEQPTVKYRYSRNGYDFHTAEYLAPTPERPDRDTNNYFWTEQGRAAEFKAGAVQRDVVSRWRWFPEGELDPGTTTLEPQGAFAPRAGGAAFRSGQTIEDLYVDAYADFLESTAARIKGQGFNWVEIDPPWQWVEEDGLPRVRNDKENNPNYADDETFLREMRAYTDAGLKVMVAPQICCTALDLQDRSEEWWQTWFDEIRRFLAHFAELAERGGASAFSFAPADAFTRAEQWSQVFASVRERFTGEVGEMVWILGPDVSPEPQTIPSPDAIKWGSELDFFLVHSDFPLSTNDEPTDRELLEGARAVANGTKALHDAFGKPILLRNGYFNVKGSWKGQTFYSIGSIPWIGDPEAALAQSKYRYDAHDHARTVHAQFRAVAESPWILGYSHFGYTHWEDPLSPWMSIRGKEAEDVWRKWNAEVYGAP